MKKSSLSAWILIACFSLEGVLLSGCGNSKKEQQQEQTEDKAKAGEEKALAYTCPMHPEVSGKEGDTCSKCGMALEQAKQGDTTKAKEAHDH